MVPEKSMTIALGPEQEQVIGDAIQAGLIERADQVLEIGLETLRRRLEARKASTGPLDADEWMRRFRAWTHSHSTTTPLLSDEAVSRDSIYRGCGL
jgi:hypothetical protein